MQLSLHSNIGSRVAQQNPRTKSRVKCCIPGCNNREGDPGFSFHRFPTDSAMRAQWVTAINHPGFYPSQSTRICSRHFTRGSFVAKPEGVPRHPSSRRRLYPNAAPSLFNNNKGSNIRLPVSTNQTPQLIVDRIRLINESAANAPRATQQPQAQAQIEIDEDDDDEQDCLPAAPAQPSSQHEVALLGQIVRVALDVEESQGCLLRELGRLGRVQQRQEDLLGQLLARLTHLVDPAADSTADADPSLSLPPPLSPPVKKRLLSGGCEQPELSQSE